MKPASRSWFCHPRIRFRTAIWLQLHRTGRNRRVCKALVGDKDRAGSNTGINVELTFMMTTLRARPLPGSLAGLTESPFERIGLFDLECCVEEEKEEEEERRRVGMMRTMAVTK
jgi:hypothetical protein